MYRSAFVVAFCMEVELNVSRATVLVDGESSKEVEAVAVC